MWSVAKIETVLEIHCNQNNKGLKNKVIIVYY